MILLTGSTGMIGRNIKEQWGEPLLSPTRVEFDLRDTHKVNEYIKDTNPEMIIHCGSNDNDVCLYDNLRMFTNLAQTGIPMITFCTGREIEDRAYKNGEYVLSKRIIKELSLNCYDHISVIQLWGCFGKHERDIRFFMSNMKGLTGGDIIVGEDKMFSYVYVDDLVQIIKNMVSMNYKEWPALIRPVAYTMFLSEYGEILKDVIGANKVIVKKEAFCNSYVGKNNTDFKFTPLKQALENMYKKVNNV